MLLALAVFLPLIGAALAGLGGRWLGDKGSMVVTCGGLTLAAAEAAIGLAILVAYFRNRGSIAVEDINSLKG